jgi:enoyl-CoA hydratase
VQTWLDATTLHIRFNNPARHNALSVDMWEAVPRCWRRPSMTTGCAWWCSWRRGRKGLCVGRRHLAVRRPARRTRGGQALRGHGRSSAHRHPDFSKPTLACIRGWCIGGGVNVAIACDMRIAASDSVFSVPAARLGLGYRYSAMKNLVDLIGPGAAKDLFFTARRIDAAEAKARWGWSTRVAAPDPCRRCWPNTPALARTRR